MSRLDRLAVLAVTGVAALLRLPGLEARGPFDVDQGRDMLVLLAMIRDGVVPLVGPEIWVGKLHHGAVYYLLLAPAAVVSNLDLVGLTTFVAFTGVAVAVLVWWLGRAMAGPIAGLLAGLIVAVSPAAIQASTFIWNPNLVPLFAAIAIAAAWRAHTGGHWAWRSVALGAAAMVAHLHLLGVIFMVAVFVLCLLRVRADRSVAQGFAGGLVLALAVSLPLIIHELQTGFAETRGLLALFSTGTGDASIDPPRAIAITLWRVISWPFVGVLTDAPLAAAITLAIVAGVGALGIRYTAGNARTAIAWLAGIIGWSVVALALTTPSMQRITVGFPNDHFHAFLIPAVALVVAVPIANLLSRAAMTQTSSGPSGIVISLGSASFLVLLAVALLRLPPPVDPDGGWPAARAVGTRITEAGDASAVLLITLPPQRSGDAIGWPVVDAGGVLTRDPASASMVVVVCDRYLEDLIGIPCGGPAEDAAAAGAGHVRLLDRFEAPRQTAISVYAR